MSDSRACGETNRGIDCDVVSCKYHIGEKCCTAKCISVGSTNALRKGETYCGTFSPRS